MSAKAPTQCLIDDGDVVEDDPSICSLKWSLQRANDRIDTPDQQPEPLVRCAGISELDPHARSAGSSPPSVVATALGRGL